MCIEQATFAHGVIHLFETGHGNSEAQQIGFKVGTHGRIEEAEETALTVFLVFVIPTIIDSDKKSRRDVSKLEGILFSK